MDRTGPWNEALESLSEALVGKNFCDANEFLCNQVKLTSSRRGMGQLLTRAEPWPVVMADGFDDTAAFTCLLEPWPLVLDDPILFTDFDRYAEI